MVESLLTIASSFTLYGFHFPVPLEAMLFIFLSAFWYCSLSLSRTSVNLETPPPCIRLDFRECFLLLLLRLCPRLCLLLRLRLCLRLCPRLALRDVACRLLLCLFLRDACVDLALRLFVREVTMLYLFIMALKKIKRCGGEKCVKWYNDFMCLAAKGKLCMFWIAPNPTWVPLVGSECVSRCSWTW